MLYMFRTVHRQELKTVYTAMVYVKQLLLPAAIGDEMELVLHVECFTRINNLR